MRAHRGDKIPFRGTLEDEVGDQILRVRNLVKPA